MRQHAASEWFSRTVPEPDGTDHLDYRDLAGYPMAAP
jgi:hypothetical protein